MSVYDNFLLLTDAKWISREKKLLADPGGVVSP
jgi:hypothetical protein